MFNDAILASSVYIIPSFSTLYKRAGKYHLGLLFPKQQQDRGLGSDLDPGVTSTLGLGVSIVALFSLDLPHPGDYDLYIVC